MAIDDGNGAASRDHSARTYTFVETAVFRKSWATCGLSDNDLFHLQNAIGINPRENPVIRNTGGLRKIRFRSTKSSVGKRGSHRVCYVYFQEIDVVLLVIAFAKNAAADLSPQARKNIKKMIDEQKKIIRERGHL